MVSKNICKMWVSAGILFYASYRLICKWHKNYVLNVLLCFVLQLDLTMQEGSGHFFMNTSVKGIVDVVLQEALGEARVRNICTAFMASCLMPDNTKLVTISITFLHIMWKVTAPLPAISDVYGHVYSSDHFF